MIGSEILDVFIGLVLVYFLLSVACSAIMEILDGWLKMRAVNLEAGIRELLHDPSGTGLARDLYSHPLVRALYRGSYDPDKLATTVKEIGANEESQEAEEREVRYTRMPFGSELPSYIPARNFAVALMDIVARGGSLTDPQGAGASSPTLDVASLRARIETIGNLPVQRALLSALDTARGDLAAAQKNLEDWFDSSMDRVSGWYKRRIQGILLVVGLVLSVLVNADSIAISSHLYSDDESRQAIVAQAETIRQASTPAEANAQERLDTTLARLEGLPLPLGWSEGFPPPAWREPGGWVLVLPALLGWLITGLALTLGAPFWFDVLNKVMVIRSTVKPKEKSPEEGSEDRQKRDALATLVVPAAPTAPTAPSAPGGATNATTSMGTGTTDSPAAPTTMMTLPTTDMPAVTPLGTEAPREAGVPTTEAMAAAVIHKHICVDAGHGGTDVGGRSLGTPESRLVLPYALELARVLRGRGHTVTLTRQTNVFVPLGQRASIANDANANLFVSLHANASNSSGVKGPWTIHARGSARGLSIAKRMQRALVSVMGGSNNAVYPDQSSW
ncbi:MAG TPA: N-acetylmuramoyl-L-alanine amidase, partial [Longimicrobium sp.]|nr:N-acetylmuramoyl-L-alanine amidase [Longimicrobium sp.]